MNNQTTYKVTVAAILSLAIGLTAGIETARYDAKQQATPGHIEALPLPYESAVIEARLIGRCNGLFYAGQEESAFPANCDWIEPIRIDSD